MKSFSFNCLACARGGKMRHSVLLLAALTVGSLCFAAASGQESAHRGRSATKRGAASTIAATVQAVNPHTGNVRLHTRKGTALLRLPPSLARDLHKGDHLAIISSREAARVAAAESAAMAGGRATAAPSASRPITIHLGQMNNSGETGIATLTPVGSRTRVDIRLKGQPAGADQPVHIHDGTCANLNPTPKWVLHDIVNGRSTTIAPVSLELLLSAPYVVNAHLSVQHMGTYVACGEIRKGGAPAASNVPAATAGGTAAPGSRPVTIHMRALNHSGETGRATLTPMGNRTRVELAINGEPAGANQPVHIHEGTCANLNPAPKWVLNNIVNGKSVTTVPVGLGVLEAGSYSVNAHQSVQNMGTFVACGEIKR
jgi:hypothetical protein